MRKFEGEKCEVGAGGEAKADPQLHTASKKKGNQRTEDEIPEQKNNIGNSAGGGEGETLKFVGLGS